MKFLYDYKLYSILYVDDEAMSLKYFKANFEDRFSIMTALGASIGTGNIDLFAKMTGLEFHAEGPVGQFALGRGKKPLAAS